MCKFDKFDDIMDESTKLNVASRSYRRVMKPRLPRKVTSSARINLNRFWNELEEFYNRYDERKTKGNNIISDLPAYTTDTYDHAREEAENRLNERLEQEAEWFEGQNVIKINNNLAQNSRSNITRARLQSYEDLEHSSVTSSMTSSRASSIEDLNIDSNSHAIWNVFDNKNVSLPSPPPLPKSLKDLLHIMSNNF